MTDRPPRRPRPSSFYDVLQVTPKAEPDVIQASYRVLARLYHPDVSRDPESAARMREINAAYDVLRDPVRRAEYDAERSWAAEARAKRVTRSASAPTATFVSRAPVTTASFTMTASPTFHGRLVLLALAVLGVLTLLLWLLLESMNDAAIALMPG
jgi:DnaJ-domain-containing protein 1